MSHCIIGVAEKELSTKTCVIFLPGFCDRFFKTKVREIQDEAERQHRRNAEELARHEERLHAATQKLAKVCTGVIVCLALTSSDIHVGLTSIPLIH